jgi:hypothetical protein
MKHETHARAGMRSRKHKMDEVRGALPALHQAVLGVALIGSPVFASSRVAHAQGAHCAPEDREIRSQEGTTTKTRGQDPPAANDPIAPAPLEDIEADSSAGPSGSVNAPARSPSTVNAPARPPGSVNAPARPPGSVNAPARPPSPVVTQVEEDDEPSPLSEDMSSRDLGSGFVDATRYFTLPLPGLAYALPSRRLGTLLGFNGGAIVQYDAWRLAFGGSFQYQVLGGSSTYTTGGSSPGQTWISTLVCRGRDHTFRMGPELRLGGGGELWFLHMRVAPNLVVSKDRCGPEGPTTVAGPGLGVGAAIWVLLPPRTHLGIDTGIDIDGFELDGEWTAWYPLHALLSLGFAW